MHRPSVCVGVILLLTLLPFPAYAMWGWVRDAAVADFEESDWQILRTEARRVLEEVDSGVRVDWRNNETGNSGAIKALMTFTYNGMTCRRLALLNLSKRGIRGVFNYNLCRQEDGQWGFVSDSEVQQ